MKKRLWVSFSGGRTSGFMTKYIQDNLSDKYEIINIFANTGQEHEETLKFVNKCDKEWGLNLVWVEANLTDDNKLITKHKIVNYETASRNGEPFEEIIKEYGISNQSWPHCTRELKLRPMTSYIRSAGWKNGAYNVAIGIRIDEQDRVNKNADKTGIVYPLIDWIAQDKQDINDWWEDQSFNLNLEEHQGNCKWCWKKSIKKHFRLIKESPEIFDFPRRMEDLYPYAGHNEDGKKRVFFRKHMSTNDLFKLAEEVYIEESRQASFDFDISGGCGEECDIYAELIKSMQSSTYADAIAEDLFIDIENNAIQA